MKIDYHCIAEVFNFVGFAVCTIYLLKNSIDRFIKDRHESFSKEFESANNGLLLAKKRFELATKRYVRANDDASSIERSMMHHADIVVKRIIQNAESEAERILEASKTYSENQRKEKLIRAKERELFKISMRAKEKCRDGLKDRDLSERVLKNSIEKASKSFGANQ